MMLYFKQIQRIIFAVVLTFLSVASYAQSDRTAGPEISDVHIVEAGDSVGIRLNVSVGALRLGSGDLLILTPVLTSADQAHTVRLNPIGIAGHTKSVLIRRAARFGRADRYCTDPTIRYVEYRGSETPAIAYSVRIPYEAWLEGSVLSMEETVTGCAECERSTDSRIVRPDLFDRPAAPKFKAVYIIPEVEPVKSRSDKYFATINFKVDQDRLDPDYMNNSEILSEVREKVASVVNNKDITVSDIKIVGYASPEASVAYNKDLSRRRSQTIADYLISAFGIPRSKLVVSGYGEDWVATRKEVAGSSLSDKSAVLSIIDRVTDPDARDAELRKLSGGKTYATLVRDIYPRIRRTEYSLSYVVAGFDVAKAREVFKQNPKLLSLNEMYLVAQSYPVDSEEYREVYKMAQLLFPENPVAIVNVSASMIESGRYAEALDLLLKVKDNNNAWNNLAITYALLHRYDEASEYFKKIEAIADDVERYNLDVFSRVLEEQDLRH